MPSAPDPTTTTLPSLLREDTIDGVRIWRQRREQLDSEPAVAETRIRRPVGVEAGQHAESEFGTASVLVVLGIHGAADVDLAVGGDGNRRRIGASRSG